MFKIAPSVNVERQKNVKEAFVNDSGNLLCRNQIVKDQKSVYIIRNYVQISNNHVERQKYNGF